MKMVKRNTLFYRRPVASHLPYLFYGARTTVRIQIGRPARGHELDLMAVMSGMFASSATPIGGRQARPGSRRAAGPRMGCADATDVSQGCFPSAVWGRRCCSAACCRPLPRPVSSYTILYFTSQPRVREYATFCGWLDNGSVSPAWTF